MDDGLQRAPKKEMDMSENRNRWNLQRIAHGADEQEAAMKGGKPDAVKWHVLGSNRK